MSILRDLFIFGFTGYSLYTILNTKAAQNWIQNSPHSSYFHGSGSEVDQIRVIAMTVSVVWMVIFMLRMVVHLARTAFKLLLVLSILVYFYMFQFDLIASYIPQIRHYGPPSSFYQAVKPAKKLLRHGLIALADRIYDLAKLLR